MAPRPIAAVNPEKQDALMRLEAIVHQMEGLRQEVASYYAVIDGEEFPDVEHEVGETMTAIRKSVARMRKALGVLAEEPLPGMERPRLFGFGGNTGNVEH